MARLLCLNRVVKKILAILVFVFAGLGSFAQSATDFPQFGNEMLSIENKIEIYPNPSTDFLNITIHNSTLKSTRVIVHNIIGSKFETNVEKIDVNTYQVDVRDLPPGYYLVSVKDPTEDFSQTFKFLKR